MMRYSHRFMVRASVAEVTAFHRHSDGLRVLTPPPIIMQLHTASGQLYDGDEMNFTMWLGPVPIRWGAAISFIPDGFIDDQRTGPFRKWVHTHTFVALPDGMTEVRDDITAEIGGSLWDRVRAIGMWAGLPMLFAFRQWKTRRLLTKN